MRLTGDAEIGIGWHMMLLGRTGILEALGFIGGPGITGDNCQLLEELGWGLRAWRGGLRVRLVRWRS